MSSLVSVLLAAGASQRFGDNKLIARLPDGDSVVVRACQNLMAACDRVLVVVRPGSDSVIEQIAAIGANMIVCADAAQGMGASLACAVNAHSQASGWLIALADMPGIQPATIHKVASALHAGAMLAAPFFNGRRGHPVGFSALLGDELRALRGDQGAKNVLQKYKAQLARIDCDDPGIVWDIDYPDDLGCFHQ